MPRRRMTCCKNSSANRRRSRIRVTEQVTESLLSHPASCNMIMTIVRLFLVSISTASSPISTAACGRLRPSGWA